VGHRGPPPPSWYLRASERQRDRHRYVHVPACDDCAVRAICDGFHAQYVARWGGGEAVPYPGPPVRDPLHFARCQSKVECASPAAAPPTGTGHASALSGTQFQASTGHRAGVRKDAAAGRQ
jgi:hypothetical protein